MSIYEAIPVGPIAVPMEDALVHDATADKPVCSDPTCPCHEDEQALPDGIEVHPLTIEGDEDNPVGYCLYYAPERMYIDAEFDTPQEAKEFAWKMQQEPTECEQEAYAERLYIEQGMAQSRESLPWYGTPPLDDSHAPYCNCPVCCPSEPDEQVAWASAFGAGDGC